MRRFAEYLGAEDSTPAEADHAVSANSADKASSADSAATLMGNTKDELAPRAVFDFVENAPAGEDLTLSADITAPEAGVLLMTGTVDALDGPDIWYFCELEIDHGLVPGSQMGSELNDTEGNGEEDCTTSGAATVAAGTHTIDFEVFDVASGVDFIAASMRALWVPFDSSGSTPSSLTDLANSSGSPAEGR